MFGTLTEKFHQLGERLGRNRKLTEENIGDAVREVRMALLEADVNYGVTKVLVKRLKEKAVGDVVIKSVSPGQQFIKLVHDELVALMGEEEASLRLDTKPAVFLMCGLQGAGKTTHTVKLAKYLLKKGLSKKVLLAACDLQRPAAVDQLRALGKQAGVDVHCIEGEKDPLKVAKTAFRKAKDESFDVLIVDTAGRLAIDDGLMEELWKIKEALCPQEVFFVANATTGQDAVNTAAEFDKRIDITGTILTMLDGNTRGGAAISIREVTKKPLVFEGVGEKLDDLQLFNPKSMADRILGMGDTINLVRKAQEHINEEDAKSLEEKIRKATFTYSDYLKQMQMVKKMGSFKSLLQMLPGMGRMKDLPVEDKQFHKIEAIILSMTVAEREGKCELRPSRRKRIARGSGTEMADVNKLVKSFEQARKFFKNMPNMNKLEKIMGGSPWR